MEEENKYLPQVEIQEYGGIFVKVMTDEQMEVLGKQIAAYSTICEQLEELHRTLSHNHDDHLFGGGGGGTMRTSFSLSSSSVAAYSLMGSSSQNKLSRRQRWNPTSEQLHILERVFDQEGIRTPNPQKVKEIAVELARHGQIAEPNVYNWFQNRRARLKKKRMFEAETNKVADESAAAVAVEEDRPEINVSPENSWPRTSGAILPVHSFQGCRRPSRDFAEMATHGRMSWEGRRHP